MHTHDFKKYIDAYMKMGMCICVAWYSLLTQCLGMAKSLATPLFQPKLLSTCLRLIVAGVKSQ